MLNGYLPTPVIVENEKIAEYFAPPRSGNCSGDLGAIVLEKNSDPIKEKDHVLRPST